MELADGADESFELSETLARVEPDVFVTGEEAFEDRKGELILRRHPDLRVLVLAGRGRTGRLYRLQPQEVLIPDLSPEALLSAIRGTPRTRIEAR